MKFSKELIEKAKTAKSAEELLAMAKENEVFRYRLTNGDGVPEYELEGM